MALIEIWNSVRPSMLGKSIEQVVGIAGDGHLRDGSGCSEELRRFLMMVPASQLATYAAQCLARTQKDWPAKGAVLQDLVNELGRRLDYQVEHGPYQGASDKVGFDGLWRTCRGHAVVVETKSSDGFPIHLETIAEYRRKLMARGMISDDSSILIVVGSGHAANLEAQIRGSRWAWDARMISMAALVRLVELREKAGPATVAKIHALLRPVEYTQLDGLVDIVFTAAGDTKEGAEAHPTAMEGAEVDAGWARLAVAARLRALYRSAGKEAGTDWPDRWIPPTPRRRGGRAAGWAGERPSSR